MTKEKLSKKLESLEDSERKSSIIEDLIEQYDKDHGYTHTTIRVYNRNGTYRCQNYWRDVQIPIPILLEVLKAQKKSADAEARTIKKALKITE